MKRLGRFSIMLLGALAAALTWGGWSALVFADPVAKRSADITSLSLGFEGRYKLGYWTPVHVDIHYTGPSEQLKIEVTVPDGDGVATRVSQSVVTADLFGEGQSDATVEMFTKIGRLRGELTVKLSAEGQVLAKVSYDLGSDFKPALLPSEQLIVTVGAAENFAKSVAEHRLTRALGSHVAQVRDVSRLPTKWQGYEGVAAVLLCSSRPEVAQLAELEEQLWLPRWGALNFWVRGGGVLIISIGQDGEKWLGPNAAPGGVLYTIVPGRLESLVGVRQFRRLEAFADADDVLLFEDDQQRVTEVMVPKITNVRGQIVVYEGRQAEDLPLLVRARRGFGEVIFLALDIEHEALAKWSGTRSLVVKMLHPSGPQQRTDPSSARKATQLGHNDLSGQLRTALNRFDGQGVRFLPFEVFCGLAVVYILLIAPGDYFFLRRIVRRMEYTWITFPLIVILACAGAYWLAVRTKGDQLLLKQASLVDIDVTNGATRGTIWFSIFSPRSEVYDLSLKTVLPGAKTKLGKGATEMAAQIGAHTLMSWSGLPGTGLGGMQSPAEPPHLGLSYNYGPEFRSLQNVPIQVWSTKDFRARTSGRAREMIQADLALLGSDETLIGSITNELDMPLKNCVLFYDRWVYLFGDIKTGVTVTVNDGDLVVRTIETHLARWESSAGERHDPEAEEILHRMMFYGAPGARDATLLENNYQSFVDFSRHLDTGAALLVARSEQPAFSIVRGNEPLRPVAGGQTTILRFVIPVAPTKSDAGK